MLVSNRTAIEVSFYVISILVSYIAAKSWAKSVFAVLIEIYYWI